MAVKVWGDGSNAGVDGDWDNALNWDNDTAPLDGDDIILGVNSVADLSLAPSVDFVAASFIIDAGANFGANFTANFDPSNSSRGYVIVTGGFQNNSTTVSSAGRFIFRGADNVEGIWQVELGFDTDPSNYASHSFKIADLVYDINNYIYFSPFSTNGYENLKRMNGSTLEPFNSFTLDQVYFEWGPSMFSLHAYTINIINDAQIGTGSYDNISNVTFNCDYLNVDLPNGNPLFGLNYFSGFPPVTSYFQLIKLTSTLGIAEISSGSAFPNVPSYINSQSGAGMVQIFSDFKEFNFRGTAAIVATGGSADVGFVASSAVISFFEQSSIF